MSTQTMERGAPEEARSGPIAEYHDREEWLLARHREGVGSSEVPIILGVDPFGRSEADLQRRKLAAIDEGRLVSTPDNDAMLRGRLLEDDCVELWQMRAERGREVRKVPLRVHPEVPLLSSADRLALATEEYPTAPLEAKVPGWRQFKKIEEGGLSDYMNVQGQVHSLVHGKDGAEWAVMRADPLAMRGFWVPADAAFGEIILEKVGLWWTRHIINREPAPELPADEASVDLSKLPKVEGKIVQVEGADADFLRDMWEARELRDEANEVYDGFVAQIKDGRFPLGVFEGGSVRLYHTVQGGGTRLKISDDELGRLIDPAKLQQWLVEAVDPAILPELQAVAEALRVDPQDFHVPRAEYQQVLLYQVKETDAAF